WANTPDIVVQRSAVPHRRHPRNSHAVSFYSAESFKYSLTQPGCAPGDVFPISALRWRVGVDRTLYADVRILGRRRRTCQENRDGRTIAASSMRECLRLERTAYILCDNFEDLRACCGGTGWVHEIR